MPKNKTLDGPWVRHKYLLKGEMTSLTIAAWTLGFANCRSLYRYLCSHKIKPGADISHIRNPIAGRTNVKKFIVNGELVSMNRAAALLGYSAASGLHHRIRRGSIEPGSDISHLVKMSKVK
ncbi:hypothetical protein U3B67_004825, partial [Escherichia coli]|nr:hypothetical protein [Escherichia coli]